MLGARELAGGGGGGEGSLDEDTLGVGRTEAGMQSEEGVELG